MRRPQNWHSIWVSGIKVILPICGILLLSTLFLWSWTEDKTVSFTQNQRADLPKTAGLTKPRFSGYSQNGDAVTLRAAAVTPINGDFSYINVREMLLTLESMSNFSLTLQAEHGIFDSSKQIIEIKHLARLETSNGYHIEMIGLDANLDKGLLSSRGQLEIRAPFGEVTAQKMTIQRGGDKGNAQMLFTDGIKMTYTPKTQLNQ